MQPTEAGVKFSLCPDKVRKWLSMIDLAIESKHLDGGSAQKLAGRLMWATQHLFHRLGRAMIKAIFGQKASATGIVGPRLLTALRWWRRVLVWGVSETREWGQSQLSTCLLFVDAASTPARCAAVLLKDGVIRYTDCPPRQDWMEQLAQRGDNQILSLEILAIMIALSTFGDDLRGRNVVLYSDNKGAECATRKGDAKAFDHSQLVHEICAHVLLKKSNV